MRTIHRTGTTLVEVLACLLILVTGALAVLALMLFGISLANRAQASATGMETARTLLNDGNPIGMLDRAETANVTSGYLNGYFVRRTITSETDLGGTDNPLRIVTVTAEVFQGSQGTAVATLRERQVASWQR